MTVAPPPRAVARRPGMRACRLRADADRAAGIARDERAAARADRVQVDRRQADRKAADGALCHARRAAAGQQADVGRRPAHVERDRVLEAGPPRNEARADDAARGTGDENRCRMRGCVVDGRDAAGREHDERLAADRPPRAPSASARR